MPKVQVAMETGEGGMETLYILIYRSTLINLAIKFAVNFTLLHAFSRNQLYKIISKCSECCALSPRKTSSFTALECTEATTASKDIFLSGCSCFSNWKGILRKQLRQWVSLVTSTIVHPSKSINDFYKFLTPSARAFWQSDFYNLQMSVFDYHCIQSSTQSYNNMLDFWKVKTIENPFIETFWFSQGPLAGGVAQSALLVEHENPMARAPSHQTPWWSRPWTQAVWNAIWCWAADMVTTFHENSPFMFNDFLIWFLSFRLMK